MPFLRLNRSPWQTCFKASITLKPLSHNRYEPWKSMHLWYNVELIFRIYNRKSRICLKDSRVSGNNNSFYRVCVNKKIQKFEKKRIPWNFAIPLLHSPNTHW